MKTLNVIGAGRVGRALARLGRLKGVWEVGCVLNRSQASAADAVEFIGDGRAVESYDQLGPADLVMIAASDTAIEACCWQLVEADRVAPGAVVFHSSGALPASILQPARAAGAAIASAHPVKSFADSTRAVESFAGTWCGLEGDEAACELLTELLRACGAEIFRIRPEQKTVYHAATVLVCNYLTALIEAGLRCMEHAGVPRETAARAMEPIVKGTVQNVFALGPVAALTGPIARGEPGIVAQQYRAVVEFSPQIAAIYRALGSVAVDLSAEQGTASAEALATIREAIKPSA